MSALLHSDPTYTVRIPHEDGQFDHQQHRGRTSPVRSQFQARLATNVMNGFGSLSYFDYYFETYSKEDTGLL